MEVSAEEKSQSPTNSSLEEKVSSDPENPAPELSNTNGGAKSENKLSVEVVRDVLQAIASTGKYWHDWDDLKNMLSFQLKQVLSEYPEAKVGDDPGKSSIRETFLELVNRLDEALQSFIEGPPFTLQRFCEILLDARGIYPVLSKLELALEKNLLVTTTLQRSTDAHPKLQPSSPHVGEQPGEITEVGGDHLSSPHLASVENGEEECSPEVRDEIMTDAVEPEVEHGTSMDMDTIEEIVGSEEKKPEQTTTAPPTEAGAAPPPTDVAASDAAAAAPPTNVAAPPPTDVSASPPASSVTTAPPTDAATTALPTDSDTSLPVEATAAVLPVDATPAAPDATVAPSIMDTSAGALPVDAAAAATAPPTEAAVTTAAPPSTMDTSAAFTTTDSKTEDTAP